MRYQLKLIIGVMFLCTLCILLLSCKERLFNNAYDEQFTLHPPQDLKIDQISDNVFTITWLDNYESEDGYSIDKKVGGGNWIIDYLILGENENSFTDTIGLFEVTHYYRVKVFTTERTSDLSPVGSIFPYNNSPTPSSIYPIVYKNQSFQIRWSKNTDDDFYKYLLYQSTTNDLNSAFKIYDTESVDDTSYTVTDIQYNVMLYYWVVTLDTTHIKIWNPSVMGSSYSKIVYISGNNQLMTMDIDGTNKQVLYIADYILRYPMFSPTGTRITFAILNNNFETHIGAINIDGTDFKEINTGDNIIIYHPQFSPDEQWLYYSSSDGIHRIDTNGNNATIINNDGFFDSFSNHFTPDGNTIVYITNNENNNRQIYKMGVVGDNITNLSNNDEYNWGPTASNNKIVFYRVVNNYQNIFIMDINGNNEINIANTHLQIQASHAFSPDGQTIAFDAYENGGKLYEYDIYSNDTRLITAVDGGIHYPVYYPNGGRIIFGAHFGNFSSREIYIVNTDGSELFNLTNNNTSDEYPQIQPQP